MAEAIYAGESLGGLVAELVRRTPGAMSDAEPSQPQLTRSRLPVASVVTNCWDRNVAALLEPRDPGKV